MANDDFKKQKKIIIKLVHISLTSEYASIVCRISNKDKLSYRYDIS